MYTVDQTVINAPAEVCFRAAADVERWPEVLPHYRWVRFHRKDGFGTGKVEMAARRDFGPIRYPVWWVSEMRVDEMAPAVFYQHVDGITTGMDVVWSFEKIDAGQTRVKIVHDWADGPRWPLPRGIRKLIADLVIGPVFIHHVASRTLTGIRTKAEAVHSDQGRVTT
jgi:ribosome-associated toxin RatA of RatAB toxin-antitoxin module